MATLFLSHIFITAVELATLTCLPQRQRSHICVATSPLLNLLCLLPVYHQHNPPCTVFSTAPLPHFQPCFLTAFLTVFFNCVFDCIFGCIFNCVFGCIFDCILATFAVSTVLPTGVSIVFPTTLPTTSCVSLWSWESLHLDPSSYILTDCT